MKSTREETKTNKEVRKRGEGGKENGGKNGRMQLVTEMRSIDNRFKNNMDTV